MIVSLIVAAIATAAVVIATAAVHDWRKGYAAGYLAGARDTNIEGARQLDAMIDRLGISHLASTDNIQR